MSGGDTIAALATPAGRGALGIVRLSGPDVPQLAAALLGRLPTPRRALLATPRDSAGESIDQVIALYFPAPGSYTGEPVLELQGHGGPVVLAALLRRCRELGARAARPGEFSERAFLNGKLDLVQAEAVADLIDAATEGAARAAARSLEGDFSRRVRAVGEDLMALRVLLEGDLDFADEADVPEPGMEALGRQLERVRDRVAETRAAAAAGRALRDGLTVVIAGAPNVGKSSLLNRLAGADRAIVTEIPGTTRDVLREAIDIDGLPLHVLDTAGLRVTDDPVESEGVRRTRAAAAAADLILLVLEHGAGAGEQERRLLAERPRGTAALVVRNKIDLAGGEPARVEGPLGPEVRLSALTGAGMDLLREALREQAGAAPGGGTFSARQRHLEALQKCAGALDAAACALRQGQPPELMAEELRLAQQALGEITGEVAADDLLGRIFATFCIGK